MFPYSCLLKMETYFAKSPERKTNTMYSHVKPSIMNDDEDFRKNLSAMRETGTFCDATIIVPGEDKTLPVHRAVMVSCGDFFRSLFTNGCIETFRNEVTIHGVALSCLEQIVEYAYTKKIHLSESNIEDVFAAADRFNILNLLDECMQFLTERLSAENCIGMLRFSKFYQCTKLIETCWRFLTFNFNEITSRSQEFVHIDVDELTGIISDDKLNVLNEDEVFSAVMKWVDFYPRERKVHIKKLMECIRLPFITDDYFQEHILHRRDLKRGPSWEKIQMSYELVKRFRPERDPTVSCRTVEICQFVKPRIPSRVVFLLGGWAKDGVTDSAETYDRNADAWFEIQECELPTPRAYHGTVPMSGKVYVLGGFNGSHYLNSVICFDVYRKCWEERAPMYMSRCYISVVEIDGIIYACGGYDGRQRHNSAEKYDLNKNQWSLIRPMFHQRSDAGAAAFRGKLYVAGGFDGNSCLFSAEVYDPVTDQWSLLAPMTSRRSGVSLAVMEDKVYAIGGYDGHRRLDTVEYLEPFRGHWYTAPGMNLGRSNFSCVVMDDIIYVMGGYDGEKTSSHVECFNVNRKQWRVLSSLHVGRSAVSACAISAISNAEEFTFNGFQKKAESSARNFGPNKSGASSEGVDSIYTSWMRGFLF